MDKSSQYGIILDAGSSGTRIYIYNWAHPAWAVRAASVEELHGLPRLKLKKSKKIRPGISAFANNVVSVGSDHLEALIRVAREEVPYAQASDTPVFLLATAGVRFLPEPKQVALLRSICIYLRANTAFYVSDCESHIQVISGETEGLYGWIATNYLLGGFDHPENHVHGKGHHHTYGFLDMGGASAQIAFVPNATESEKHAKDLKLVRMRRLDGSSVEYKIFTASWLGFGANKARSRYIARLQQQYDNSVDEIPDPCMPKGLRTRLSGDPLTDMASIGSVLVGTGAFEECLRSTYPLLRKDTPCVDQPCLLNGQNVPAIDFNVNHFVGVSEYWHATHGVFGKQQETYNLAEYQRAASDYCNRKWTDLTANLAAKEATRQDKERVARQVCFKASWLIIMLHDGIGIPRTEFDAMSSQTINLTKELADNTRVRNMREPFQPINQVNGMEVSWTIGKMVLYATGQIPFDRSTGLPVGFGSNAELEMASDFEQAGSIPLISPTLGAGNRSNLRLVRGISSFVLLILALLLAFILCLLRRSECRRRLRTVFQRRQHGASRKLTAGSSSFISKILGRNAAIYERVMEEGNQSEFELRDRVLDGQFYPGGSNSPRSSPHPSVTTPKLNLDRFDDSCPPSEIDRNGLVIRTESRDRLAPTLQMLNAGRRSRGGSPTRLKSPLITPLED